MWLRCGACCPRSGNWLKASRKMSVPVPFKARPAPLSAPLRQISTMLAAIILPSVQKLPQGYDSATPSKMWPAASIAGLLLTRAISARGGRKFHPQLLGLLIAAR